MYGKKKRNKSRRKRKAEASKNIPARQLAEQGMAFLETGNFRNAIKCFKSALNKEYDENLLKPLMFRAYVGRKTQLLEKNMPEEARSIKNVGHKFMPSVLEMDEDVLRSCVGFLSIKEWIGVYNPYMKRHGISAKAEKKAAHVIFAEGLWDQLSGLDPQSPLARDADVAQGAAAHMENASWGKALEIIKKNPRSSPYFGMHVFAKAMDSFMKDDDKGLKRALSDIPDDFPLKFVVLSLSKWVSGRKKGLFHEKEIHRLFWDPPSGIFQSLDAIIKKTSSNQTRGLAHDIKRLARIIYPQDPDEAAMTIFGILGARANIPENFVGKLGRCAASVFSPEKARVVNDWLHIFSFDDVFSHTISFIEGLDRILPGKSGIRTAHSLVLTKLSSRVKRETHMIDVEMDTHFEDPEDILGLADLDPMDDLGDGLFYDRVLPYDEDDARLLMLLKAVSIDPGNREAYDALMGLKLDRAARKKVIPVLEKITRERVDDPFVCLDLAGLYYAGNAFQKAEKILEEGLSRAPHNARVQEKCALSHLVAADKNIKRKKFHLVAADMEKAEKYDIPTLRDAVACKRILLETLSGTKDFLEVITKEWSAKKSVQSLKRLFLLWEDFESLNDAGLAHSKRELEGAISTRLAEAFPLPSKEAAELFAGYPDGYGQLYPPFQRHIGAFLFQSQKIMFCMNDDDFLAALHSLLRQPPLRAPLCAHLEKRISRKSEKQLVFGFYLESIRLMQGKGKTYPREIKRLIKAADSKTIEVLKVVSKTVAHFVPNSLEADFVEFDFKESGFPFFSLSGFDTEW